MLTITKALLAPALLGVPLAGVAYAETADHAETASAAPVAEAGTTRTAQTTWVNAYARGQWSAAIELLETMPEGSRTAWQWLHLARARAKLGQLVEAFAAYERLREVAHDASHAPGAKDVLQSAAAESAALAERIPWADVSIGMALPAGALVFVDQQWLEPGRLRSPYPVNPGWHTFLVESNGSILAARRVHFEEGQNRLVPLGGGGNPGAGNPIAGNASPAVAAPTPSSPAKQQQTAAVQHAARPASATRDAAAQHPTNGPAARQQVSQPIATQQPAERTLTWRAPDSARLDDDPHGGLRTAAYVSLGIGGLGTLIGTGLAISALSTRDDNDAAPVPCFSSFSGGSCSSGTPANERWRSQANAAAVSYTIGLVGLVTGGILWLAQREYASQPTLKIAEVEIEPRVKANGAVLHGRF